MTKFSGFASRRDDRLLQDVLWHRLTAACVTDSPLETATAPEAELRCGSQSHAARQGGSALCLRQV